MKHLISFGLLGVLFSSGVAYAGPTSPIVERGKALYGQYCGSCHGPGGTGDGVVAESLKVKPADLTQIAARRDGAYNDKEIAEIIDGRLLTKVHGGREMPVWGDYLGEGPGRANSQNKDLRTIHRIAALNAYLKSIQQPAKPAPAATP